MRPDLGGVYFLDDEYARRAEIEGAVILKIAMGSEASRIGLKGLGRNSYDEAVLGDVIVAIDGTKIKSYDDLYNALDAYKIGDVVTLTVIRNGKERSVRMKLTDGQ